MLVVGKLEDLSKKGRMPGYSFGVVTKSFRHCFEGSSGGVNVIPWKLQTAMFAGS
jgi:hypothetical protein